MGKKYHIIYKTICIPTNKYYIGMHCTDNLNDGYLGSGKIILRSLHKYGINAHIKETIGCVNSYEMLKRREREIITNEVLSDPLCMNLKKGGRGDWDYANKSNRLKIFQKTKDER